MAITNITAITVSIILTMGGLIPTNTIPEPPTTLNEENQTPQTNDDITIITPPENTDNPTNTPPPEIVEEPENTESPQLNEEPQKEPPTLEGPPTDTPTIDPFTDTAPTTTPVTINMRWVDPIKPVQSYKHGFIAYVDILDKNNPKIRIEGKLVLNKIIAGKTTHVSTSSLSQSSAANTVRKLVHDPNYAPTNTPTTYTYTFIPAETEPGGKYTKTTALKANLTATIKTTKNTSTNLAGKTLSVPRGNNFSFTGKTTFTTGLSREIHIQKHNTKTKKWETIGKTKTSTYDGSWRYTIGKTKESSQLYRVHAPAEFGVTKYTGPNTKMNRPLGTYTVQFQPPVKTRQVPWINNTQTFFVDTKGTTKTLTYQYRVNSGKWKNVKTIKSNPKTTKYTFKMIKGTKNSATQNMYYRLVVASDTYHKTTVTKTSHVIWENPTKYKGIQKEFYDYAKFACPNTFIRFDYSLASKGKWGEADLATNANILYPDIPKQHRRTVAIHECAHQVQYQTATNKNNKGWQDYLRKANKPHGTTGTLGMERTAECMAQMWAPNSYWAYGSDCRYSRYDFALRTIRGQTV